MYFNEFPNIYYPFKIGEKDVLRIVKDITTNVRIRKEVLSGITVYDTYDMQDGDTPDIIASKYYGSSLYHWAIMLANDMYDYQRDFPRSTQVLDEYVDDKYNKFEAVSWSYGEIAITATIPGHGIVVTEGEVIRIENAYVDVDGVVQRCENVEGGLDVTGVTEDTITFLATGDLEGTPVGGLTLYTYDQQYQTHHYELDGYVVNADSEHSSIQLERTGAIRVTNYEHETALNDAKRILKLITPDVVSQIARELVELI